MVDSANCKGKYKDIMLVVMSIDANKQIYLVVFGLGDKENDESWMWFLRRLDTTIGHVNGLVFVSDRRKSIVKSIMLVYLDNFHAMCIHHLSMNLMTKFFNNDVCMNFMLAVKAYQESIF